MCSANSHRQNGISVPGLKRRLGYSSLSLSLSLFIWFSLFPSFLAISLRVRTEHAMSFSPTLLAVFFIRSLSLTCALFTKIVKRKRENVRRQIRDSLQEKRTRWEESGKEEIGNCRGQRDGQMEEIRRGNPLSVRSLAPHWSLLFLLL